MNFEHTEDRRMLADSLNRFVAEQYGIEFRNHSAYGEPGYAPERWQQFAELGAIGALFPEDVGGFGGAGFDIAVVFECLGRGLVPEPFLGALVVGRAMAAAGTVAVILPGAFYTLRETYLHRTYVPGDGPGGNAVVNGVYQGTVLEEVRSFHHFNLSTDADEAFAKAVADWMVRLRWAVCGMLAPCSY